MYVYRYPGIRISSLMVSAQYFTALRLPGYFDYDEVLMVFDTGATDMHIFRNDLETIAGPLRPPTAPEIFVMGEICTRTVDGSRLFYSYIMLEATLTDGKGRRLSKWVRTPAYLMPGSFKPGFNSRLDGQWVRRSLYTGSAPTQTSKIIHFVAAATERSELRLPHVPQDERPRPDIPPSRPVEPGTKITLKDPPVWVKNNWPKHIPEPASGVIRGW